MPIDLKLILLINENICLRKLFLNFLKYTIHYKYDYRYWIDMKFINYIIYLKILLDFFLFYSCTRENITVTNNTELTENPTTIRFAVMPFVEGHHYQYDYDMIQEALFIALRTKGYHVEYYSEIIDSIEKKLDINLTNLNDQQAKEVADYLDIHIIIFGRVEFDNDRPIVIKALDAHSNKVILRERLTSRTDWGLYHANKDLRTMAKEYIDKLMLIYSRSDIN